MRRKPSRPVVPLMIGALIVLAVLLLLAANRRGGQQVLPAAPSTPATGAGSVSATLPPVTRPAGAAPTSGFEAGVAASPTALHRPRASRRTKPG